MTGSTSPEEPSPAPSDPSGHRPVRSGASPAEPDPTPGHPSGSWWPLVPVAVLCYLPFLLTRRGWVSADTKTYLYLDPGRLLERAWSIWDPNVGLGTVSHQTIGYLWPMGPWYWLFETLGVPDWVAQRLWWGTLLFAAVSGTAYLLRRFHLPAAAIWPAALVFGMSPYAVAYLGRLSGVLLPAIGLPWLLAFTIQSVRSQRWRHPALFALTVTTVGSINLTALVLVGIAPLLWLPWAVLSGEADIRQVLRATARIGLLCLLTSAWWLAGLSVQASHGIDIVRYTESAEVVARTALALEVLRGLGYWFFYGGDKLELWIEPSFAYTKRRLLHLITFLLPTLALASGLGRRWRHRTFFAGLLVVGVVLSVGANPWSDPPLVGRLVKVFLETDRGLAFRSLPRAVPLIALASAALIGGFIAWVLARHPRAGRGLAAGVAILAVVGMIPLWQRSIVQDSLARQDVPPEWVEATRLLDERDDGTRVLELPGSDFASYRWGNTVDPITPGMMDRPYVARELVPWGSPLAADLTSDLDLLLQERTLEPEAIAPIARLMRAGDLSFRGDLQYERYALARPRQVWDLLEQAPGIGEPVELTEPVDNRPTGRFPMWDETWMLDERFLPDAPAVAILPVQDSRPIIDLKPAEGATIVSGDGAGLVDAAAARRIDGGETIRYSASLDRHEILEELDRGAELLVTDTNRERGERWGSLRHNRGETERVNTRTLDPDLTDNRLPRFPDRGPEVRTMTVTEGPVEVDASSYGNPITYAADDRAALALDGDLDTAWATAAFSDARGERILITPQEPISLDHLVLNQLTERRSRRMIRRVRIDLGDGDPVEVDLDGTSRTDDGQRIELGPRTATKIEITILADDLGNVRRYEDAGPVGFAEIRLGDQETIVREIVRVPTDLVDAAADSPAVTSARLTYLFSRIRQDPTDRTRDDEERAMARRFRVPADRDFTFTGTARLSGRADDPVLDLVLGSVHPGVVVLDSSHRLAGSRANRASAAFDGDPDTAWTGPWALTEDEYLTVRTAEPHRFETFDLTVVADGLHTVPEEIAIRVDRELIATVEVPPIDDGSEPGHTVTVPIAFPAETGTELRIEFSKVRPARSVDWTANEELDHPISVVDVDLPGVRADHVDEEIDDRCRADLVELDGERLPIRILGTIDEALDGAPLRVEPCADEPIRLEPGDHDLVVRPGVRSGFDLDQVQFDSGAPVSDAPDSDAVTGSEAGRVEILSQNPDSARLQLRDLEVGEPVWLILGQSHNDGWRAVVDGLGDLGPPQVIDGYANGWLLTPTTSDATVELRFTPQKRVDLALLLSAISLLPTLGLAIRRPRGSTSTDRPIGFAPEPGDGPPGPRARLLAPLLVGVGSWAIAGLPIAVALTILTALATRRERFRWMLRAAPAVLLGVAALGAVALAIRHDLPPGIEWVADLQPMHPIALAAVLALAAQVVLELVSDGRDRGGAERGEADRPLSPWWRRRSG